MPEFRSYTTIEVARRLGVSLQTVQRWVDAGHLKAWKTLGGHRRIDADSADRLIETQERVPADGRKTGSAQAEPDARLHVLLVDDNPVDMALLSRMVRRILRGCDIRTASDGFQALVIVGNSTPDVLITDVNMPHMDGFEMIRSLATVCTVRPRTIVAVSSLSPSDLAARGRMLPEVQFLSKPVDEARFAAVLAEAASGTSPKS